MWCALVLPALAGAGCGGALANGESQFKEGRYPEAKATFASIEAQSRSYDDAARAEYALYRGLTLLALGDRAQAAVWLREAKAIDETRPESLSREDAMRLKEGLATANASP
jgi:tetratricopeptide (TPR) repeat protein